MTPTDLANVLAFLERTAAAAPAEDPGRASIGRVVPELSVQLRKMTDSPHDNGGPAFPAPDLGDQDFGQRGAYPGMSLRDYFAAKALHGVIRMVGEGQHQPGVDELPISAVDFIAVSAYRIADAMLKARDA